MSVRIAVVGHVDNGKSTLIGRLMSDTGQVHAEKIGKVQSICRQQGRKYEYAFLLDALEEEQAQGITMDVTEVQWSFEDRVYTFVDTPGHREFLKKMVGGASRVDAALLIVDAVDGVSASLLRQLQLLEVLGVEQILVLVNKMDLVEWRQNVFFEIKSTLDQARGSLSLMTIPISAWNGENLLAPSKPLSWYQGPTLVNALSRILSRHQLQSEKTRFQVQDVYRYGEERIYVGRVECGQLSVGDTLEFAPSGATATVTAIHVYDTTTNSAVRGDAVGISIDKDLFLDRGSVGYFVHERPQSSLAVIGDIFWLDETPLKVGERVHVRIGTQATSAVVDAVLHETDEDTFVQNTLSSQVNLIGRVSFRFDQPVWFDGFNDNDLTSRFVVARKHVVVGGGRWLKETPASKQSHKGHVLWFTGFSGAGKSTLAQAFQKRLEAQNRSVFMLDGDVVRTGLCRDLGFSMDDRLENIRRSAEVAKLAADSGQIVLAAFISPLEEQRELARSIVGPGRFSEVFVDCPMSVCEQRDVKGLYAKARRGEIPQFTGIGSDYQPPKSPDVHIPSGHISILQSLELLEKALFKSVSNGPAQEAQ